MTTCAQIAHPQTAYYYVDETSQLSGDTLHAVIGGIIVRPHDVFDLELAIEQVLKRFQSITPAERRNEFKYTDFFRLQENEIQHAILHQICEVLNDCNCQFLASHAVCERATIDDLLLMHGTHDAAMNWLALQNVSRFLSGYTTDNCVQIIVDLGLDNAFRPLYEMYVSTGKAALAPAIMGVDEKHITRPNFRNLPPPLFVRSNDSRLIQIADVVIGLKLAEAANQLTEFKRLLLASLSPIAGRITFNTVRWQINEAQLES